MASLGLNQLSFSRDLSNPYTHIAPVPYGALVINDFEYVFAKHITMLK